MALTRARTTALLISPAERDHEFLQKLFAEQGWTLFSARSLGSGSILLRQENISVVLTERDLPLGSWRDVLEIAHGVLYPPLVIVTSLHADEQLWAEALNLGAYDVLAKPLDQSEIVRVLTSAWIRHGGAFRSIGKARGSAA
jgi:DNA-binding NtrC family response regulator